MYYFHMIWIMMALFFGENIDCGTVSMVSCVYLKPKVYIMRQLGLQVVSDSRIEVQNGCRLRSSREGVLDRFRRRMSWAITWLPRFSR